MPISYIGTGEKATDLAEFLGAALGFNLLFGMPLWLAGLVTASAEYLGPHAGPVRDGLKTLQLAFRESSAAPDDPGHGPGEKYTGPVCGL